MLETINPFGTRTRLQTPSGSLVYYSLPALEEAGFGRLSRVPYSMRVLLENLLRHATAGLVSEADIARIMKKGGASDTHEHEVAFSPSRVIFQDFTGGAAMVDLATMRSALARLGRDAQRINPLIPADFVVDHSVAVDYYGTPQAFEQNVDLEYHRNSERYQLFRWAQQSLRDFRVVPPNTGIVHQVNLEYLASVVRVSTNRDGEAVVYPDSVLGTDSHTTMINGLGIFGFGVGGIEAEAVLLGQPYFMPFPQVVGFKLTGRLPEGATTTDLVLTITQMLRQKGVVGKFVEYYGDGITQLSVADRATVANMAPEYGATMGYFPIDARTLEYLRDTGREAELVDRVERYYKAQGMFREDSSPDAEFDDTLQLDLATVEPSLAGPKRPQDRVPLRDMQRSFAAALAAPRDKRGFGLASDAEQTRVPLRWPESTEELQHGSVVIAAITSCTNTSNPSVLLGAGLMARAAVARGMRVPRHVKTSLAPGSRVVTDYLAQAGLLSALEALGFNVVAYGCTTCVGNSGPLPDPVAQAVKENDLVVAAVLSGNRNFEARVHAMVKANYLASPMLVVAYALAGTVRLDLDQDPLGKDAEGQPVYLRDLWPSNEDILRIMRTAMSPQAFQQRYASVFDGDEHWRSLPTPQSELYAWDPASTYIREAPYFDGMTLEPPTLTDIRGARVLVSLGDSITTDHISPVGAISPDNPAGRWLTERGVARADFNSFGARRSNHEVMVRGTFGNVRLRNFLVGDTEGWWTRHLPSNEKMTIYDASLRYREEGIPLLVLAGQEYGTGSSRDWAAKGPALLGVKAVLAQSFERIHRSNLVGMGILPLQFLGESRESLGLTGEETFDIDGVQNVSVGGELTVWATDARGAKKSFRVKARLDTPTDLENYRNGGIMQTVLRKLAQ